MIERPGIKNGKIKVRQKSGETSERNHEFIFHSRIQRISSFQHHLTSLLLQAAPDETLPGQLLSTLSGAAHHQPFIHSDIIVRSGIMNNRTQAHTCCARELLFERQKKKTSSGRRSSHESRTRIRILIDKLLLDW